MTNTEIYNKMEELKPQMDEAFNNNDFELYNELFDKYRILNNSIR